MAKLKITSNWSNVDKSLEIDNVAMFFLRKCKKYLLIKLFKNVWIKMFLVVLLIASRFLIWQNVIAFHNFCFQQKRSIITSKDINFLNFGKVSKGFFYQFRITGKILNYYLYGTNFYYFYRLYLDNVISEIVYLNSF